MNIRKIIARLTAHSIRYGGCIGGIPELTEADISGALGFVQDKFAREIFCAIWWQEGSRLVDDQLLRMIALKQRREFDRQLRALQVAKLESHIIEDDWHFRAGHTYNDYVCRSRSRQKVKFLDKKCWPYEPEIYSHIRVAVLREMRSPNNCALCNGRATIKSASGELIVSCNACEGTGVRPRSQRDRSLWLNVKRTTYDRKWRYIYEWTYDLLSIAEHDGASALIGALSRQIAA